MANFGNLSHFSPKFWSPNIALKILLGAFLWDILNLQCSQDQKSSKVDPDDHVEVIFLKHIGQVADDEQDDAGDEDDQDVTDQRTSKGHSDFHSVVAFKIYIAHYVALHSVLCERLRSDVA